MPVLTLYKYCGINGMRLCNTIGNLTADLIKYTANDPTDIQHRKEVQPNFSSRGIRTKKNIS